MKSFLTGSGMVGTLQIWTSFIRIRKKSYVSSDPDKYCNRQWIAVQQVLPVCCLKMPTQCFSSGMHRISGLYIFGRISGLASRISGCRKGRISGKIRSYVFINKGKKLFYTVKRKCAVVWGNIVIRNTAWRVWCLYNLHSVTYCTFRTSLEWWDCLAKG